MRVIIAGAGQVGQYLCEKLSQEGQEVVLIDNNENKLRRLERNLNILPVQGSAASARILEEAGIDRANLFIAVTDSDEVNLISCIISQQYKVQSRVARVRNEDFYGSGKSLTEKALGVDLLISPDIAMADETIKLSQLSDAFDVAEFAGGQVVLLGYKINKGNPAIGLSLVQLQKKQKQNSFVIVSISREDKTIIPHGDTLIKVDDRIYVVARKKDILAVESLFQFTSRAAKKIFIIGGGAIGYLVAKRMEQHNFNVCLVEEKRDRCHFLTSELENTVVLNFDGLESDGLLEEGIDMADLVIAVTENDTTNLLSSLLAKHHGAKRCITKITRPDFIPLLGKLGIDVALSPRLLAADLILSFVRGRGKILSVATIQNSDAEVMEMLVPDDAKFRDVPLKFLNLPMDAVIGAIVRKKKVIIPSGETNLKTGDKMVIFATREAIARVEAFFE
ncbi:MAG: Trk system potassium transporter TrkA [Thermodesulfobacteriota bacterium]